jgi:hypothetical protein
MWDQQLRIGFGMPEQLGLLRSGFKKLMVAVPSFDSARVMLFVLR